MLSIGEVAHATGVSRRTLRHWEELGLVAPARVDPRTGYRRYARSQVGRVRSIAALRALDFGLVEIRDLLGPGLTQQRLVELLRARERELADEVAAASARLAEVRRRLRSVEGGPVRMTTAQVGPLPALHLTALQRTVRDETEIAGAVAALLPRLREHRPDDDVVLTYDGGPEDGTIVVTAGVARDHAGPPGARALEVPATERGVSVHLVEPPADTGDAWVALDAVLEERGLETTGVYRQLLLADGGVVLQAPVRDLGSSC